ncbi:MMPL family transporter [Amycolatopsis aidingensis]|uniref:MMPL family transporter n=1 Tax=Amycolatopsis aidingensis TaxID=2842453 RepID=UPI001C0DCCDB|nr:MMPL family transporter [Amycolatopsis aidingensis]
MVQRIVLGLWVLALAIAVPIGLNIGSVQSDKPTDRLPADAESTRVAELMATVPGGEGDQAFVVYHRAAGITDRDRELAARQRHTLPAEYESGGPPVVSADGTTLMYGVSNQNPAEDEQVTGEFVDALRQQVAGAPEGLTVEVTGPAAIGADVDAVFEGIDETLMLVTTVVVALLLIVTYRSPFLWLLPLLAVGASALASMAAVYGLARATGMTISTQSFSIMIVLVFGAGTDYAMLLVARYREQLPRHAAATAAMRTALRGVGPAILAAGGTVVLGLLCLLAARMNDISGLGLVGAIGIGCTLLAMLTLLPALLLVAGRKVFWPRVPRFGALPASGGRVWGRAARVLLTRPARSAVGSALALGALALGVLTMGGELGETDQFTSTPESVRGYATLGAAFPQQGGRPLTVAAPTGQADRVATVAGSVPGVSAVRPDRSGPEWTLLEVQPAAAPDTPAEEETVRELRAALDAEGHPGLVGGPGAERIDTADAAARDNWVVLPLALAVVLLVLVGLLRAVLAPLMIVGTVLLCFAAALGLGALAFDLLFGFAGTAATLPALGFVFGIALGIDYSIFLVSRVRDDLPRLGTAAAAGRAVAVTGPVIASAGVVLAATFAVLMTMPFVSIFEIGFVVAAGVLLQTLVVQPALVAPLLVLGRRRMWWPGGREPAEPLPETRLPEKMSS